MSYDTSHELWNSDINCLEAPLGLIRHCKHQHCPSDEGYSHLSNLMEIAFVRNFISMLEHAEYNPHV